MHLLYFTPACLLSSLIIPVPCSHVRVNSCTITSLQAPRVQRTPRPVKEFKLILDFLAVADDAFCFEYSNVRNISTPVVLEQIRDLGFTPAIVGQTGTRKDNLGA
eukprot:757627-Hanusia_phi.AAC.5